MFSPRVTTYDWLRIPMPVRLEIVRIFNIPRSSGTVLQNNIVISDGYTQPDLDTITKTKLEEYFGVNGDFENLFISLVDKITADLEVHDQVQESPKTHSIKLTIDSKTYELEETGSEDSAEGKKSSTKDKAGDNLRTVAQGGNKATAHTGERDTVANSSQKLKTRRGRKNDASGTEHRSSDSVHD